MIHFLFKRSSKKLTYHIPSIEKQRNYNYSFSHDHGSVKKMAVFEKVTILSEQPIFNWTRIMGGTN